MFTSFYFESRKKLHENFHETTKSFQSPENLNFLSQLRSLFGTTRRKNSLVCRENFCQMFHDRCRIEQPNLLVNNWNSRSLRWTWDMLLWIALVYYGSIDFNSVLEDRHIANSNHWQSWQKTRKSKQSTKIVLICKGVMYRIVDEQRFHLINKLNFTFSFFEKEIKQSSDEGFCNSWKTLSWATLFRRYSFN